MERTAVNRNKIIRDTSILGIVAGSAILKFALGLYTIAMGRKANSSALEAVGVDCRNDAFGSAAIAKLTGCKETR